MPKPDLGLHCWPRPVCPKIKDHYGNITGWMQDFRKGGSFWIILSKNQKLLNFHENPHENEIGGFEQPH